MLFNSYEFIFVFLPVSFFIYFYLNHKRLTTASKIWLVFASLFFYSWWNIVYLPLILTSVFFNYAIASAIVDRDELKKKYFSKKSLLQIGLVFNIGLLAYFKYADFFISNTNSLVNTDIGLLHLALPLAISFFTLQQIAFLVDSYEGLAKEKKFINYIMFVTFFPQLIAGPIVHHKEMMPQFVSIRNKAKNYKNIALGLFILSIGLFKKVVIADTFAIWATAGFDTATTLNLFEAWFTSLSYTFQLYFDFSGYTDIAMGAALLFNIKLPINFNSPYKATGIIDFWQRWHITLSRFVTTYIYTPLVKSFDNLNFHKAMVATFVTFLIAGLWHGASWMFVIFGGLHGLALVVNNYWKKTKIKINKILAWFITFNFVNITMVFFRAEEWDDAIKVLSSMFSLDNIMLPNILESVLPFLNKYGVEFGWFTQNIQGKSFTLVFLIIGFILVLFFENSSKKLIDLQKEWTSTSNFIPKETFSIISKRFKIACNNFFRRKKKYYEKIYNKNLKRKQELLKRIERFTLSNNSQDNIESLENFSKEWKKIGLVPKKSVTIDNKFHKIISSHYNDLNLKKSEKESIKFLIQANSIKGNEILINKSKNNLKKQIDKIKSSIFQYENNVSFFRNENSTKKMKESVLKKIELSKLEHKKLKKKLSILDNL